MAPPTPHLAVRGSDGTFLLRGPPNCEESPTFHRDERQSKHVTFTRDGTLFGWCNGEKVSVIKVANGDLVKSFDLPKTTLLGFSPLNKVLVTWKHYTSLQHITEYRQRNQGDITPKITLPDELNEFYARFEAPNTGQQHKTLASEGILDTPLTASSAEVCMALRKTNPLKAAGPDNIPGRALMVCSSELADVFTDIYNLSLTQALVPTCFKSTTIIPLPKNTVTCLNDYRSIALTPIAMKCFERIVMSHIKRNIPTTVDPFQFAYRQNRSTEDAVNAAIHTALTLGGPQAVRVGNRISGIRTVSTGTPQGCVLSPLLYTLFTYDCVASQTNTKIIKFADDTAVIGLITGVEETSYRTEVAESQDNPQGEANLQLWDLQTGNCIKAFYQKKVEGWCPSWADDESIAVRCVNNELHFFENNNFETIANKLHLQKVSDFSLSPGTQPSKVAVYVPGSKGAPSFVRLYQYPNFSGPSSALANKSFFKADKVTMLWNKRASAVLVTASTEVDKTGASYYGEQTLHYLATNGDSAVVQLPKNGPIYDVTWSPSSSEFCVVYGFMPAKATVFNLKCEPIFDFGTGPRNAAFYSPQGHILVLAGFGNLRGQMEVWDVKKYKQVSKPQAADTTFFSWCPDGEHIVTATCSPRLRVSNGYKIWHYTGTVLYKQDTPAGKELWEVVWQPFLPGTFPENPVKYQVSASDLGSTEAKPTQAYRPPALRNKPESSSLKLHEEEPPQNMKPGAGDKQMSKAALKNQRRREAKKAAKQENKSDDVPTPASEPQPTREIPVTSTHGDPETDKKIKNLKKKLKAIDELKEQQAAGKPMQKNQLEKIQKEAQLLKELESLELGL
ncbi:hypothetical protein QTP70_034478 [Hemibagrus guttatus]|uniref:Eukaryotic translation initiation factor 2A n=1 Tax=Hemibagrus guttatus TaxID=175788 RepID=A0AAE0VDE5_9TELE|nr:hypothetical protein QTP70_034478 [Hemibagrus guttatus]